MKRVSILVPTYNRPAKLYRFLDYFNRLALDGKIPQFVEVIVADGSDAELQTQTHNLTKSYVLSPNYALRLLSVPGLQFVDRMKLLAESAEGDYVLYVGDDDLPIFDGIEKSIQKLDNEPELAAIAGRFINITGFGLNKLCLSMAERPYSGFRLDSPDKLVRLGALVALNSVGLSSLTYSLQRKNNAIDHYEIVSKHQLFHGGLEFVHQVHTTIKGDIYFTNTPFIYRDFTFIGYGLHEVREAPDADDFPYLGRDAVRLAASFISDGSELSADDAFDVIASLVETMWALQESRQVASVELESLPIPHVEKTTVMAMTNAWYTTLKECYPDGHVNFRRLFGSMPMPIRRKIYSIRSYILGAR